MFIRIYLVFLKMDYRRRKPVKVCTNLCAAHLYYTELQ